MGCRNATEPVLASAHLLFVTEDFAVFECDTGYAFLSQTEGISWCEDGAWTEPTGHCQQLPTSRDTTRWTTEATLTSQPNLDTTWWTTNATVTSQPNLDTTWWTTKATVTSQPNPDTTSDAHDPVSRLSSIDRDHASPAHQTYPGFRTTQQSFVSISQEHRDSTTGSDLWPPLTLANTRGTPTSVTIDDERPPTTRGEHTTTSTASLTSVPTASNVPRVRPVTVDITDSNSSTNIEQLYSTKYISTTTAPYDANTTVLVDNKITGQGADMTTASPGIIASTHSSDDMESQTPLQDVTAQKAQVATSPADGASRTPMDDVTYADSEATSLSHRDMTSQAYPNVTSQSSLFDASTQVPSQDLSSTTNQDSTSHEKLQETTSQASSLASTFQALPADVTSRGIPPDTTVLPVATTGSMPQGITSQAMLSGMTSQGLVKGATTQTVSSDLTYRGMVQDATSQAIPPDLTSHDTPIEVISSTEPPDATSQVFPIDTTSQTLPRDLTSRDMPADTTSEAESQNATSRTFPIDATTPELPNDATSNAIPPGATSQTLLHMGTSQAMHPDATSQAIPADTTYEIVPTDAIPQTMLPDATSQAVLQEETSRSMPMEVTSQASLPSETAGTFQDTTPRKFLATTRASIHVSFSARALTDSSSQLPLLDSSSVSVDEASTASKALLSQSTAAPAVTQGITDVTSLGTSVTDSTEGPAGSNHGNVSSGGHAFLTGDAAAYYISVAIGGLILLVIVLSIVFSQRRARAVRRRKSRLLQGSGEDGASTTKASELAVYSAPPYGAQDEETLDSRHPMEVMRRQQHFDSTLDSRRSDKSNYVTVIKIPSFSEYPSGSTMPRLGDPAFKSENREGSVYGYVSPLSAQKTTDPPQRQGRPDPGMSRRPPAPPPEEAGAVPYPQPYDITASALNMTDEGVYDQIPSLSGGNKLYIGHAPAANTAAVSLSRPWGDHQASGAQQNNAL